MSKKEKWIRLGILYFIETICLLAMFSFTLTKGILPFGMFIAGAFFVIALVGVMELRKHWQDEKYN